MSEKYNAALGAFNKIKDISGTLNIGIGTGSTTDIFTEHFLPKLREKIKSLYSSSIRTTELLSQYFSKLCELEAQPCEPSSTRKDLLHEMYYIRTLIDAAKAKVEFCQSPNEGMELYNFAKKKLKKITCTICC